MSEPQSFGARLQNFLSPVVYLSNNWTSRAGIFFVTAAGVSWLFLLPVIIQGAPNDPYIGLLVVFALPMVFFTGLILIPIGIWFERRKKKRTGGAIPPAFRKISLDNPQVRQFLLFVLIATAINVVIGGQLTMRAVDYMEHDQFCGQTCHTPMQPEYTAYLRSNHAKVPCTDCHVGEGAGAFIQSKISGMRQLALVTTGTYDRPIPSPVHELRPAAQICERCHWPYRFAGDMFLVRTHYASDEQNTPATTVALMRVGGQNWKGTVGIHGRHSEGGGRMEYIATDNRRQVIPQVTYTAPDGKVTVYKATDVKATAAQLAAGEHRTMDCMDCHNRPTHVFELPEAAVDKQMLSGQISTSLPFIKKEAVEVLRRAYPDRDAAAREIANAMQGFYRTKYPQTDPAALQRAIQAVQATYAGNVFPDMKVTWGTYPNNLGHTDAPGCFRCHDGNHVSSDGRKINDDCGACHDLLAVEEQNPKILKDLGPNVAVTGLGGNLQ
jgi:nitrate/TMAO reductase-like tetraheme cytochrome c subunit